MTKIAPNQRGISRADKAPPLFRARARNHISSICREIHLSANNVGGRRTCAQVRFIGDNKSETVARFSTYLRARARDLLVRYRRVSATKLHKQRSDLTCKCYAYRGCAAATYLVVEEGRGRDGGREGSRERKRHRGGTAAQDFLSTVRNCAEYGIFNRGDFSFRR